MYRVNIAWVLFSSRAIIIDLCTLKILRSDRKKAARVARPKSSPANTGYRFTGQQHDQNGNNYAHLYNIIAAIATRTTRIQRTYLGEDELKIPIPHYRNLFGEFFERQLSKKYV